jgi:hypothetical protein
VHWPEHKAELGKGHAESLRHTKHVRGVSASNGPLYGGGGRSTARPWLRVSARNDHPHIRLTTPMYNLGRVFAVRRGALKQRISARTWRCAAACAHLALWNSHSRQLVLPKPCKAVFYHGIEHFFVFAFSQENNRLARWSWRGGVACGERARAVPRAAAEPPRLPLAARVPAPYSLPPTPCCNAAAPLQRPPLTRGRRQPSTKTGGKNAPL